MRDAVQIDNMVNEEDSLDKTVDVDDLLDILGDIEADKDQRRKSKSRFKSR